MLRECLAVFLGGAVGSLFRYAIVLAASAIGTSWLPMATLLANLLGCLAMGWLGQWSLQQQLSDHWLVIGARIGLLGGLTTFSSFAMDVFRLGQSDKLGLSLGLAAAHLTLGLLAVFLGIQLARH